MLQNHTKGALILFLIHIICLPVILFLLSFCIAQSLGAATKIHLKEFKIGSVAKISWSQYHS